MRIPVKLDQTPAHFQWLIMITWSYTQGIESLLIMNRKRLACLQTGQPLRQACLWGALVDPHHHHGGEPWKSAPLTGWGRCALGGGGGARLCGSLPAMPRERVLSPNYPVKVRGSPHMPFFSHSDTEAHNTVPQGIHHNNSEQHRGPRKDTQAFK